MITLKEQFGEVFKVNVRLKRRISEDEVEMDRKSWERRNSDMAPDENNRQLESQQMELDHANQWACQAPMKNRRILEEEAMKSRLYQESHANMLLRI